MPIRHDAVVSRHSLSQYCCQTEVGTHSQAACGARLVWSACRDALKEEIHRKLGQIATLGRDLAEAKNESTALQKQLQVCGNPFAISKMLSTRPEHCAALLGDVP